MPGSREIDIKTRQRIAANLRFLKWLQRFDSAAEMARAAGVTRQAMNRCLSGQRTAGLDVLLLIHRRLHVSLDWLVDRDPDSEWFDPDYEPTTPPENLSSR